MVAAHLRFIYLYHAGAGCPENDLVNMVFSVGVYGVPLFFMISGFILALPFARYYLLGGKSVSLREYYVRRVTRIEPPYLIHLFLCLLLCVLVLRFYPNQWCLNENPDWLHFSLRHIGASLIYSHGFIYGAWPVPNPVLWSLEVEVQFYLISPFLAQIFLVPSCKLRRILLGILICLGPFLVEAILPKDYLGMFSLLGNYQYFLAGILLADFYLVENIDVIARRKLLWDLTLPLALTMVVLLRHKSVLPWVLPWLILAVGLAAFRGRLTPRILSWPWLTTIGGMCYTIYMYHWLLLNSIVRLTGHWRTHILWLDLMIQFLLMSTIITVICSFLFVYLERPFMQRNWPRQLQKWFSRNNEPNC